MDRAKAWALRCVHESRMYDENCFVTLTYNPEHLPKDGSVSKRDMQLFMKRLRKEIEPRQVRFYGCGEYGSKLGRPHYHVLLFNFDFSDKELLYVENNKHSRSASTGSYKVYSSRLLDRLWTSGFTTVGDVTFESCGYVARYIGKKIGGEKAIEHYKGKEPEFALMSRKPGIGAFWFSKFSGDVFPKDFTTLENGRRFKPPKFYVDRLMRKDWEMYLDVKMRRDERVSDPDIIRRRQKEKYLASVTKTLERSLEYE